MSTHFFNDAALWQNDGGIPNPLTSFTFPTNKIIQIKKFMLSALGYYDVTIPNTTTVKFLEADIKFITRSLILEGIIEMNVNSTITVDSINQSESVQKLWSDRYSWTNQIVPVEGADVDIPQGVVMVINSSTNIEASYGNINLPTSSSIFFDGVTGITIMADSFTLNGTIISAGQNTIKKRSGSATLYIPVYLDSQGQVLESIVETLEVEIVAGSSNIPIDDPISKGFFVGQTVRFGQGETLEIRTIVSFGSLVLDQPLLYWHPPGALIVGEPTGSVAMDASYNFTMHCDQTKASTFGKFIKYMKDSQNNHTFKFDPAEKTIFETELITDISNQTIYHFEKKFLTNTKLTSDNTLDNFLIQYISSVIFDRPDVNNVITNQEAIKSAIISSNLQGQISSSANNSLNSATFEVGNTVIIALFDQINSQVPQRLQNNNANVEYNFPILAGDTIAIFINMRANLFFNQTFLVNGHSQTAYDFLKTNTDWVSNYDFLEFDDTNKIVKVLPTTWKIVMNLA